MEEAETSTAAAAAMVAAAAQLEAPQVTTRLPRRRLQEHNTPCLPLCSCTAAKTARAL